MIIALLLMLAGFVVLIKGADLFVMEPRAWRGECTFLRWPSA